MIRRRRPINPFSRTLDIIVIRANGAQWKETRLTTGDIAVTMPTPAPELAHTHARLIGEFHVVRT